MATIPIISPAVTSTAVVPITPTASDTIPCAQYNLVFLVIVSSTGTPNVSVTDPTAVAPAGLTFTDNTVDSGALTAGQTKVMRLDAQRFRDVNGNINVSTATPANSTVYAIGI